MPPPIFSTARLIGVWTLAAWFVAAITIAGGATLARADQTDSGQGLGSVADYEQSDPHPTGAYQNPLLGIEVKNETEWLGRSRWLQYGRWVSGVEILGVNPGSAGREAGLQGSRQGVLHTMV